MVDTDNQFYKIKKQVSYFKSIINNTPGCIFWKNKEGIYLGCNHVFVEMAGLDKIEEVIGKTDEDLCWKHDAQLLQKHDKSVMKSGKSLSIEEEITLASGERRLYSVVKKPLLDDSNNIIGVLGTAIDITYRQIAQNELTEARKTTSNYLQNIIESLPEYIYWKDQDLVYQGCNYRVANSLDLKSPRDIIGKTDHDFGWSQNRIAELHKIDNLVLSEGVN